MKQTVVHITLAFCYLLLGSVLPGVHLALQECGEEPVCERCRHDPESQLGYEASCDDPENCHDPDHHHHHSSSHEASQCQICNALTNAITPQAADIVTSSPVRLFGRRPSSSYVPCPAAFDTHSPRAPPFPS